MDNDVYGHVNNVVYYSWFDTAVNAHLIEQGVLDIHQGETIGLVVETQCNYFAPLAFPQTIEAGIRVAHRGTSSVKYEVGLVCKRCATHCCTRALCSCLCGQTKLADRKPFLNHLSKSWSNSHERN
jgi:acyl-CoA thioesterase FadM